ncbi:MAG: sn-glycerol-3-phosphate ABC transporter ATP-binding protein UgpC [Actinomycetota bacterium]|nr:sn-glycerol-3-phosphate ABC transporter ATP-binding protein UgpC [Actinomycetota bacterium]
MAGIFFDSVNKVYPDGTQAVFDLSLEVADNEFMILVGPSGCGKSTALRMVAGLEEITSGELRIGDNVVNNLSPRDRDIAMVFQSYALYPHMSVADNMGFALKLAKVSKDEIDRRVHEAAEILGLKEYLHRKPKALSGGQRQRVAMGRAIVRSPQAYLMDEPLSNLDAKLRVQMRGEIAALQDRLQVTTLYVTHDQVEAMTMGDRVAVLKLGWLQQVASPTDLYERPDNIFVAGFIGSPAMNLSEATVREQDGRVVIDLQEGSAITVDPATLERYPRVQEHIGGRVAVGIRPEHFAPVSNVAEDRVLRGLDVTLVEALGAESLVHVRTRTTAIVSDDMRAAIDDEAMFEDLKRQAAQGGQSFVMRFAPDAAPRLGQRIDVGVLTDKIHLFNIESGRALR